MTKHCSSAEQLCTGVAQCLAHALPQAHTLPAQRRLTAGVDVRRRAATDDIRSWKRWLPGQLLRLVCAPDVLQLQVRRPLRIAHTSLRVPAPA